MSKTYSNPFILHHLYDRKSVDRIDIKHSAYEIFGSLTDIFPFWIGECILTSSDTFLHSGRNSQALITIEWRETAQPIEITNSLNKQNFFYRNKLTIYT